MRLYAALFDFSRGDDVTVITPFFRYSNYAEAVVWWVIGAVVAVRCRRRGTFRGMRVLLAASLVAFGGSDVVEAHTGAWWNPWWLFVWKALCVLAFAIALFALKPRRAHATTDVRA